ncbi:immunoglobulin superfamily member 1-like [Triplophysa dalaica]|uniref:immunoglobulin superfamily member 1-like n=1 Tax=Triplophysa dalaica TaxID=1582913 RepID=UPI0024E0372D|nr:immunoglobulin superfamily member 1-like [Triplophysa dalaica]
MTMTSTKLYYVSRMKLKMHLICVLLMVSVSMDTGSVEFSAQPAGVLIAGESLNLMCSVITPTESLLSPTITFLVDGRVIMSNTNSSDTGVFSHRIHKVTSKHSGRYRCAVRQQSGELKESRHVLITVTARKPKPTLSVDLQDGLAFSQNPVSMICSLSKHQGWMFHWYKDGEEVPVYIRWGNGGGQATYWLWRAEPAHNGHYRCRAGRGEPQFYSEYSQTININITDLFTSVTLTVTPDVVNEGQTFQLACHAELSSRLGRKVEDVQPTFTFLWNGSPVLTDSKYQVYSVSHGGRYSCVAVLGNSRRASQEMYIMIKGNQTTLILTHVVAALVLFVAPAVVFICRFIIKRCQSKRATVRESESCPNNLEVVQDICNGKQPC